MKIKIVTFEKILLVYFCTICVLTVQIAYRHSFSNNKWFVGDWLINYNGGFVRRGLFGQIAILFDDPKLLVLFTYIVCYLCIFICNYLLLCNQRKPIEYFLVILSPAIFLFHIHNTGSGYRKEIIALTILSINCLFNTCEDKNKRRTLFYITLAIYPAIILSHEMLAVFLPLILIVNKDIIYWSPHDKTATIMLTLVNLSVFIITITSIASQEQVYAICSVLGDFCSDNVYRNGSITWLMYDSYKGGLNFVYNSVINPPALIRYCMYLILSIACLIPIRKKIFCILSNRFNLIMFLSFVFGIFSLAFVASDWDRLIYMLIFATYLLSFTYNEATTNEHDISYKIVTIPFWYFVISLVYASIWSMQHHSAAPTDWLLVLIIKYLVPIE